jgi:hypothetical protein
VFVFFFFFWHRVLWSTCPGWLQTIILLIFDSCVARTTGMSQWHRAYQTLSEERWQS